MKRLHLIAISGAAALLSTSAFADGDNGQSQEMKLDLGAPYIISESGSLGVLVNGKGVTVNTEGAALPPGTKLATLMNTPGSFKLNSVNNSTTCSNQEGTMQPGANIVVIKVNDDGSCTVSWGTKDQWSKANTSVTGAPANPGS